MKKQRKYYRVKVHRVPPYSYFNGSYYYEEDVYAFSKDGALNSVAKYHRKEYGENFPVEAIEITKEEFRGAHKRFDLD